MPEPSIAQLQAIHKAIHGECTHDLHRLRAAYILNIPFSEVTDEQRMVGKRFNYNDSYAVINSTSKRMTHAMSCVRAH